MELVYVYYLVGMASAWTILYFIVRWRWGSVLKDSRNLRFYPLFIMVRSIKLTEYIDKISSSRRLFWKILSNLGLSISIGLSFFALYYLVDNLKTYLFRPESVGIGNIVIPLIIGVTIRLDHLPYMLIAFAIVLITHEGMHGIVARLEGIKLRSTGAFIAFIFPGGFVEPDEEDFNKSPTISKMKVAAAGSFANLVVGILTLFLIMGLFLPTVTGVVVLESSEEDYGPKPNEVIYSINGVPITPETLFQNITIVDYLIVETNVKNYTYQVKKAMTIPIGWVLRSIGVIRVDYYRPTVFNIGDPELEYSIYRALWWLQLIAFGVAIFNMLPVKILDGHLLYMTLIQSKVKDEKKLKIIDNSITIVCLTLLALNIFFTYRTFGFFQL
ncbi:MAG: site-2 protease family protein [Aigarchaeota archaeon]|nr:site-2 protease family protein [Aigarchaeota archaeon]MCX8192430.1 site-2 protease family protein [Nitrososphaeria archaeon]MDW7986636.1 site-2 protease family protein [Nitrososphaerota archaeon]